MGSVTARETSPPIAPFEPSDDEMANPSNQPPQPSPSEPEEKTYRVIPPVEPAAGDRFHDLVVPEIVVEDEDEEPSEPAAGRFQFTIRDMLLLMTGVAIWLGAMTTLHWSWSIAAGLSGVAALVSLLVLMVHEPENPSVRLAWWGVLGVYVLTCLAAIVAGS